MFNYFKFYDLNFCGIIIDSLHPLNISFLLFNLSISQLEISGKDTKEEQFLNILSISVALDVFHFEMSGRNNNDEHPSNISEKFSTFEVFHFEISDKNNKEVQL